MIRLSAKQITLTIGNKMICQDVSFDLHAGEIWGILGSNGAGKTTLLHALAGLHAITGGEIALDNIPLRKHSIKSVACRLAILFQDFNSTFPQTVWEYCLASRFPHLPYFKKETAEDERIVEQALHIMELGNHAHCLITTLSGGEKRRLAIAALLAQTPAIYLLDEPTNHLDVRHQSQTLKHFRQLADTSAAAVIMTLHDINLAQTYCDRVLLLFPDGYALHGETHAILTAENLSELYQHPMQKLTVDDHVYWTEKVSSANI